MNTMMSTLKTLDAIKTYWTSEAYKAIDSISGTDEDLSRQWQSIVLAAASEPSPDMDDGAIWQ